jgi:hypothetical protein
MAAEECSDDALNRAALAGLALSTEPPVNPTYGSLGRCVMNDLSGCTSAPLLAGRLLMTRCTPEVVEAVRPYLAPEMAWYETRNPNWPGERLDERTLAALGVLHGCGQQEAAGAAATALASDEAHRDELRRAVRAYLASADTPWLP